MPVYEYQCSKCKKIYNQFRNISDRNSPSECSVCGFQVERAYKTPWAVSTEKGGSKTFVAGTGRDKDFYETKKIAELEAAQDKYMPGDSEREALEKEAEDRRTKQSKN